MSTVKSTYVEKPLDGNRYAISDIHGCSKTFKKLLKKIDLNKKDQLFLIGDLINRGPKSDKVLNYILKLKAKGFQVFFIRGNHEQMALNSSKKRTGQQKRQFRSLNSLSLLENEKLNSVYNELLQETYHFVETEDYFLVHAGFNHKSKNPMQDTYAMLNIRKFDLKENITKGKSVIIGHTPNSISFIKESIQARKIYIDNGCINYNTKGQGRLLCFDLDKRKITRQKNRDI
ncbi:MAG: serine/threonine protein phosphatase [Flavobacteriales bacterium]|nr:serine/threonine protein phosphatase [Flavobacteriales bacterium]